MFQTGAEWSARPSVVTWNLGGRIPENTSGFLHARKEGKVGGLGSFMRSLSMPFAPGKHGIFGDAGGLGSKDEARNDIWSKDTSAARISGAFGGLVGSVGNSGLVDGYTMLAGRERYRYRSHKAPQPSHLALFPIMASSPALPELNRGTPD